MNNLSPFENYFFRRLNLSRFGYVLTYYALFLQARSEEMRRLRRVVVLVLVLNKQICFLPSNTLIINT